MLLGSIWQSATLLYIDQTTRVMNFLVFLAYFYMDEIPLNFNDNLL